MHELMACVASMIIMTMFILQTAANTNTFIEAVYCERTISEYMEEEYAEDEIPEKLKELKEDLEKMPGVRADFDGNGLDLFLDGVIGPAKALGISDNSIHIERELELKTKAVEDEEPYNSGGDPYAADASEQDPDGDDLDGDLYDIAVMDEVDNNQ